MPAATDPTNETQSGARSVADDATRSLNRSHGSFELALAPVIMALLGLWLDRTIDTTPLFTILFAVVGVLGSSIKLYYGYKSSMARLDESAPWRATTTGERS